MTNGEKMILAAIEEARFQILFDRVKIVLCVLLIIAAIKYLVF